MIHSIYFPSKGDVQRDLTGDAMQQAIKDANGLLWVSLETATSDEIKEILSDTFHFHPLAIEDCTSAGYQTAKVDDFGHYLFIIAHALSYQDSLDEISTLEVNLFLGPNYLVTCYTDAQMPPVSFVWRKISRDERITANGADFLCHAILDALVDDYMPIVDELEEEVNDLEDQVLEKPNPQTLERLLNLKHSLLTLRRVISPQRELVNRLSRDNYPQIDKQSQIYFRDIYDHLVRIQDLLESIRDEVSSAMDIYLNSTSLRLNEVMKALTIVSTIFLPLSFVAGVYGMNFHYMPELSWKVGYPLVWLVFIGIAIGMLTLFRKKRWY
jgi:magnesium transporter